MFFNPRDNPTFYMFCFYYLMRHNYTEAFMVDAPLGICLQAKKTYAIFS